jgi:hypothetical protein
MKKGHYGEYTGNARHSRKQEMIHDRELIYDAKTQLHQADQDYKNDSPLHYRPGDIHSGSTGAYDAENNEFSAAIAGVEGGNLAIKAFGEGATSIITAVGEKNKQDANVARNKDQTQRNSLSTINTGDFGNKHSWETDPIDGSNKSNPWLGKGNFGHEDAMREAKIAASSEFGGRIPSYKEAYDYNYQGVGDEWKNKGGLKGYTQHMQNDRTEEQLSQRETARTKAETTGEGSIIELRKKFPLGP